MIKVRHITQVCREVMAAFSDFVGEGGKGWDALSDLQRRVSVFLTNAMIENPDYTVEGLHNAWMGEMIHNEGWALGPYDEAAKTHPNLVPFEQLPREQRVKYALTIGVVRGMVAIQDRYENCTLVKFDGPVPVSDAHFTGAGGNTPEVNVIIPSLIHPQSNVGSDVQFLTGLSQANALGLDVAVGPSETIEQVVDRVVDQVVDQVVDRVVDQVAEQAVEQVVEQVVDQAVDSTDAPVETDPARAE